MIQMDEMNFLTFDLSVSVEDLILIFSTRKKWHSKSLWEEELNYLRKVFSRMNYVLVWFYDP